MTEVRVHKLTTQRVKESAQEILRAAQSSVDDTGIFVIDPVLFYRNMDVLSDAKDGIHLINQELLPYKMELRQKSKDYTLELVRLE